MNDQHEDIENEEGNRFEVNDEGKLVATDEADVDFEADLTFEEGDEPL